MNVQCTWLTAVFRWCCSVTWFLGIRCIELYIVQRVAKNWLISLPTSIIIIIPCLYLVIINDTKSELLIGSARISKKVEEALKNDLFSIHIPLLTLELLRFWNNYEAWRGQFDPFWFPCNKAVSDGSVSIIRYFTVASWHYFLQKSRTDRHTDT